MPEKVLGITEISVAEEPVFMIHGRIEAGRDLWRSSGPASLLKQSQLPRTMSRRLPSISSEGGSTTSLGNLCQCSVTLRVQKYFLTFRGNLPCFSLCLWPPVFNWAPLETPWLHLLCVLPTDFSHFTEEGARTREEKQ
ncbi:uncharacterized protein ACIQIH_004007 [Cyanocitta cristata]